MQQEIWKPIKGYEEKYSISNFGRIRNKRTSRITEGRIGNHGYKRVSFRKEGEIKEYLIHRLVAETFIENKQRKRTVNHIDGNKTNNNIENLEWATDKDQPLDRIIMTLATLPGATGRPDDVLKVLELNPANCLISRTKIHLQEEEA